MRLTLTTLALTAALLSSSCQINQTGRVGSPERLDYPPYNGPQIVVLVDDFTRGDKASYLDPIVEKSAKNILATELSRSRSVITVNRDGSFLRARGREAALRAPEGTGEIGEPLEPRLTSPDFFISGMIVTMGVKREGGHFAVYNSRTDVVECSVEIYVKAWDGREVREYGVGKFDQTQRRTLGMGESTTFDRTLFEKAFRYALYDCWTRLCNRMAELKRSGAPRR